MKRALLPADKPVCYCFARLKQMSPVVVLTFSTGPPPFSLPSAWRVLGPH